MSHLEDRLLPVLSRLMGRKSPDWIYSNEPPPSRGKSPLTHVAVLAVGIALGAMALGTVSPMLGYQKITLDDEDALRVIHQVDPGHEVKSDEQLARLWGNLAAGYHVMRTAIASAPDASTYPFLATLTGHPPPEISPGTSESVVLLANALNLYPTAVQGLLVHRMISLAAALDQPGVQTALSKLALLPPDLRDHLFASDAAAFLDLVALERALDEEHDQAASLQEQLKAKRDQTARQVADLQAMVARGDGVTRACQHHLEACEICLSASHLLPVTP